MGESVEMGGMYPQCSPPPTTISLNTYAWNAVSYIHNFFLFYLGIPNGFFPLHLGHAFTIIFVLLLQDDGKELMQACADEEWELAEGLIMSGSTLEAQDKVIVIVCRWYMNLSTYIITIHQHYYASLICHAGALR